MVKIKIGDRKPVLARVLLDSGSQVSFVTDRFVRKLKIPTVCFEKDLVVAGVGDVTLTSTHSCNFVVESRVNNFAIEVEADVIALISYTSPNDQLIELKRKHFSCVFADNQLSHDYVDIILGAEYVEECLEDQSFKDGMLKLRKSKFGYVVSGTSDDSSKTTQQMYTSNASELTSFELNSLLKKYWEIEECSVAESISDKDRCISHFFREL